MSVRAELLAVDVAVLQEKAKTIEDRLDSLEKENQELRNMANRWKGFGAALIGIGTFLGWMIAEWEYIKMFFGLAVKVKGG